jgi:hypothetical protein
VAAGADGLACTGAVDIEEGNRRLAEVSLNAEGQANAVLPLAAGDHELRAVYVGDETHRSSASSAMAVQAQTSGTPSFQLSLTPVPPSTLPMTLTAGHSGSATVTVTPVDNAALTAPMFVTLSCSGLPNLAACSFAPEVVEIQSTTPTSCSSGSPASACPPTSLMVIETQSQGTTGMATPPGRGKSNPVAWALLLPGILGLGGVAWGARRRRWLQRLALIALIGLVTTIGTTGCSPLYNYYHHGPPVTPGTPAGTYTVTVTAQSSNGVSAISVPTTFVLTVQ